MSVRGAAALVLLALGFTAGWEVQGWRWGAADAERAQREAAAAARQVQREDRAASSHEQFKAAERARVEVVTREVERVVEKPVYRNVCLEPDGLRVLAEAIGRPATAASQPAPAMPAADPAR